MGRCHQSAVCHFLKSGISGNDLQLTGRVSPKWLIVFGITFKIGSNWRGGDASSRLREESLITVTCLSGQCSL